jgi:hypothetical protein
MPDPQQHSDHLLPDIAKSFMCELCLRGDKASHTQIDPSEGLEQLHFGGQQYALEDNLIRFERDGRKHKKHSGDYPKLIEIAQEEGAGHRRLVH